MTGTTWRGVPLSDMPREQLIDVIEEMGEQIERERASCRATDNLASWRMERHRQTNLFWSGLLDRLFGAATIARDQEKHE